MQHGLQVYNVSMKLIVGLGNPGEEYIHNRHNVGFMFLDYLIEQYKITNSTYKIDKYLHAEILQLTKDIVLVKPTTFMNLSGKAVTACIARYKLHVTEDVFVIHDDLDIPLGKFKIQKGNGPLMHNGIDSIEEHLHTKDFWRVRIGVDNRTPEKRIPGETYVLQDFTEAEQKQLQTVFTSIVEHPLWVASSK